MAVENTVYLCPNCGKPVDWYLRPYEHNLCDYFLNEGENDGDWSGNPDDFGDS